jgi:hypothetical protein
MTKDREGNFKMIPLRDIMDKDVKDSDVPDNILHVF